MSSVAALKPWQRDPGACHPAEADISEAVLVLRLHDLRMEIPCTAIVGIAPCIVPLPEPGLSLWMRSGRRLRYSL